MSDDFDSNEALRRDARRVRRLNRRELSRPPPYKVLEYAFWTLAFLSLVWLVAAMPWVGAGKLVPGWLWLLSSLSGCGLGVVGGLALRLAFGRVGRQIDRDLQRRFEP